MKTFITLVFEILVYVCMILFVVAMTWENQIITTPLQQFLGRELGRGARYGIGFGVGALGSFLIFGLPVAILQINSSLRVVAGALKK